MHSLRQLILWIGLAMLVGACTPPPAEDIEPPPEVVSPEGQTDGPAGTGSAAGSAGQSTDPGATASGLEAGLGPDGKPIDPEAAAAAAAAEAAADCPPPCEFPRDAISDPSSALASKIIYFDYDQSEIKPEYLDLIAAHGRYLASYPDVKVRLEGHTDERGAREYNIALGERRGQSVQRLLLLQGVGRDQLSLLSYGEELPAALAHTEEAWSQNRRVELVYETR